MIHERERERERESQRHNYWDRFHANSASRAVRWARGQLLFQKLVDEDAFSTDSIVFAKKIQNLWTGGDKKGSEQEVPVMMYDLRARIHETKLSFFKKKKTVH